MARFFLLLLCFLITLFSQSVQAQTTNDKTIKLSLEDAVKEALANNLNLTLQREDTKIAAGSVDIANSKFDKQFNAEAGYESIENTPLFIGGADEVKQGVANAGVSKRFTTGTEMEVEWSNNRFDTDAAGFTLNPSYGSTVSVGLSQPLLRGWGTEIQTAPVTAAEIEYTASTYLVDDVAADLAALVKQGYWNLVFAWQDIEVKRLSVTLAQRLLEETIAKIDAGKLAEVEVYQPQSEVTRREEDLITAERAIGVADDELKLLLNTSNWVTPFSPVDLPYTEPIELSPQEILNSALSNRPDIKAANMEIDAARIREKVAEDNLRPDLSLVGRLGYGGTDDGYGNALDSAISDPDTSWQVGFNLSVPLDNSAAKGSLQQARARHIKAQTNTQLLRLRVTKSVRTTVRDVELAIKAMEATRKTSLASQKRLEAEQAKFDAGRSTTLDVLIAQEAYSQALSQENRTNIFYAQTLAELDRIQGKITLTSAK